MDVASEVRGNFDDETNPMCVCVYVCVFVRVCCLDRVTTPENSANLLVLAVVR